MFSPVPANPKGTHGGHPHHNPDTEHDAFPPGRRGMDDRVSTKPNKSGETHMNVTPAGTLTDVK